MSNQISQSNQTEIRQQINEMIKSLDVTNRQILTIDLLILLGEEDRQQILRVLKL